MRRAFLVCGWLLLLGTSASAAADGALTPEQKSALAALEIRLGAVVELSARIDDSNYHAEVARQIEDLRDRRLALEKNYDQAAYETLMHAVISRYQIIALWLKEPLLPGPPKTPDPFAGQSLSGWTTLDGQPVTQGWEASSGEIRLNRSRGKGGHIITVAEFGDFDLSFEWKIAARGNSGLKYRVQKYGNQLLGLEYQIYDDPEGKTVTRKSAGALYDLYEPAADRLLNPPGEWNSARIIVHGRKIEHWLNGRQIVCATVGDEQWQQRIGESKFVGREGFGENATGRIMLTDHGSDVVYRNFVFRQLER